MSEDRVAADVPVLMQGAADIQRIGQQGLDIAANLYHTLAENADAVEGKSYSGGHGYKGGGQNAGEFGVIWYNNYKPGEQAALDFLDHLKEGVGLQGNRTKGAALVFEEANSEADGKAGSA